MQGQLRAERDERDSSPPLERVVLSEQVKNLIVDAIMNGEFQPGDRIVESALARKLGVSQAPVREAVRDLALMGFLHSEPHKGTTVRSFTKQELVEVYVLRAALESVGARQAASRLTEADEHALQETLDEMIKAGRNRDLEGMTRLDNAFHEAIIRISGNKLLHQLWQFLEFGYWTIVTARISTLDLEYLAARHEELLRALQTRDPEKAAQAMRHHIEDLGKPTMEWPPKSSEASTD